MVSPTGAVVTTDKEKTLAKTEVEAFGITYDRAAITDLQQALVAELALSSVLESPSHGAKAAGSLYSVGFARAGCDVTLVNPEPGPLPRPPAIPSRSRSSLLLSVCADSSPSPP